ncbi:MAG: hypothetical protein D6826_10625 [Alphaproteobacteria bacterium]|nr:MAG: hypothetical protein D6826_10625 [Alphaproteobacteria bacterium]
MTPFETARNWIVLILAEVLNVSTRVIESTLPGQPRWLAYIRLLEEQLRTQRQALPSSEDGTRASAPGRGAGRRAVMTGESDNHASDGPPSGVPSLEAVLASHIILRQAFRDIEARGLALDEALLERMVAEWTPKSIVSYFQSCEEELKRTIADALNRAAEPLSGSVGVSTAPSTDTRRKKSSRAAATKPAAAGRAKQAAVAEGPAPEAKAGRGRRHAS